MMGIHEIFDGTQSIVLIGALVFYVYDRIKTKPEALEDKTEALSEKLEQLDAKLTGAMTRMADTVSSLAVSVGRLEGRMERNRL